MTSVTASPGPLRGSGPPRVLAGLVLLWVLCHALSGAEQVWLTSYLDDVLCLPLILGLILMAHRLRRGDGRLVLPRSHGLAALVVVAVWFEGVMPRVHPRYTADSWDLAAYALGLVLFQLAVNRPDPRASA